MWASHMNPLRRPTVPELAPRLRISMRSLLEEQIIGKLLVTNDQKHPSGKGDTYSKALPATGKKSKRLKPIFVDLSDSTLVRPAAHSDVYIPPAPQITELNAVAFLLEKSKLGDHSAIHEDHAECPLPNILSTIYSLCFVQGAPGLPKTFRLRVCEMGQRSARQIKNLFFFPQN
jgi:hypothetical protein